jgi:hypothetical protein
VAWAHFKLGYIREADSGEEGEGGDVGLIFAVYWAEVRALCGRTSTPLRTALTEDDEEPIGCGIRRSSSLPVFLSGPFQFTLTGFHHDGTHATS